MTDRELLEKSAQAAGIVLEYRRGSDAYYYDDPDTGREEWCPLENDRQALRLAVKLHLVPRPHALDGTAECGGHYEIHHHGAVQCAHAATRRAIVRAAAALASPIPSQDTKEN